MSVQQVPNYDLTKYSFSAQVRFKDVGIARCSKNSEEGNSSVTSKVKEELKNISTKVSKFLKLIMSRQRR